MILYHNNRAYTKIRSLHFCAISVPQVQLIEFIIHICTWFARAKRIIRRFSLADEDTGVLFLCYNTALTRHISTEAARRSIYIMQQHCPHVSQIKRRCASDQFWHVWYYTEASGWFRTIVLLHFPHMFEVNRFCASLNFHCATLLSTRVENRLTLPVGCFAPRLWFRAPANQINRRFAPVDVSGWCSAIVLLHCPHVSQIDCCCAVLNSRHVWLRAREAVASANDLRFSADLIGQCSVKVPRVSASALSRMHARTYIYIRSGSCAIQTNGFLARCARLLSVRCLPPAARFGFCLYLRKEYRKCLVIELYLQWIWLVRVFQCSALSKIEDIEVLRRSKVNVF